MGKAIFQQKSDILGVGITSNCGVLTPTQLTGLGELAGKLGNRSVKLTTRQTLILFVNRDCLEELKRGIAGLDLRIGVFGEVVRNIKACAGHPDFCLRANSDIMTMASTMQNRYMDQPTPRDFKISLAGCFRGCTDPYCADFGVIATGPGRFSIYLGGRGGSNKPVHARKILDNISENGVEKTLAYVLDQYRAKASLKERLCSAIEKVGLKAFIPPEEMILPFVVKDEEDDFLQFAGL